MEKPRREAEEVVAILERALANTPWMSVESPAHLEDRDTGRKREVDVAVRGQLGSHHVLIIIECRDRVGNEDLRWIEELASKRESVGANRAVAVSTQGFTENAAVKAKAKNIDLRTLRDFQGVDAEQLMAFPMQFISFRPKLVSVDAVVTDPKKVETIEADFSATPGQRFMQPVVGNQRVFHYAKTNAWYSIQEILHSKDFPFAARAFGASIESGECRVLQESADFGDAANVLRIRLGSEERRILRLTLGFEVSATAAHVKPKRIQTYQAEQSELGRKLDLITELDGRPVEFTLLVEPVAGEDGRRNAWRIAGMTRPRYANDAGAKPTP